MLYKIVNNFLWLNRLIITQSQCIFLTTSCKMSNLFQGTLDLDSHNCHPLNIVPQTKLNWKSQPVYRYNKLQHPWDNLRNETISPQICPQKKHEKKMKTKANENFEKIKNL